MKFRKVEVKDGEKKVGFFNQRVNVKWEIRRIEGKIIADVKVWNAWRFVTYQTPLMMMYKRPAIDLSRAIDAHTYSDCLKYGVATWCHID